MREEAKSQVLEIGDKVKMNVTAIKEYDDMDGIETTNTGENYLKYMLSHPDEVYTVVGLDFAYSCPYILSGPMGGNTWGREDLIYVPEPKSRFEIIKNMTIEEMAKTLVPMFCELCEDGIPTEKFVKTWLETLPSDTGDT